MGFDYEISSWKNSWLAQQAEADRSNAYQSVGPSYSASWRVFKTIKLSLFKLVLSRYLKYNKDDQYNVHSNTHILRILL